MFAFSWRSWATTTSCRSSAPVSSRDTSAIWCRPAAAALCRQVAIVAHDTTPCPDKNVRLLFFNVSVRNQPIFITFGAHIWQKHTNIFCNFAYLKIHLACVLTLGYFRCIQFLRKATEIWPDAYDLSFTRYSGNVSQLWWTCYISLFWIFFRFLCIYHKLLKSLDFWLLFRKWKCGRFYWDTMY